jgi:hypothetical protein
MSTDEVPKHPTATSDAGSAPSTPTKGVHSPKKQNKAKVNKTPKKNNTIGPGPHRLETPWSFWHSQKVKNSSSPFESGLTRLGTCNTVEEFWR